MGDLSTTVLRPKDSGPSTFSCPMLNTENYTVRAIRIKVLLKLHNVWDAIEGESADAEKNNTAIAVLFQSIP